MNPNNKLIKPSGRILCRFSCGAASAVATKLAIEKYGTVEINYSDTGSEHPDNARFIDDCEKWFGQKITITKSEKYQNIWEVFEKKKFLVSPHGAPCTAEMKRKPGDLAWKFGDTEIFGYTADEKRRVDRWKENNFERIIECPLIDRNLTKDDCFGILNRVGIELPAMYKLGFRNNNCIGCVKASNVDYWKRVRKHFPLHFARMAKLERQIGATINRISVNGERQKLFLDEIEEGDPKGADPNIQCGLFCMAEADAMK
jgi:3'-phosphoadenosine 5'-phosphosulfate sulfotransferase (PAPS reductase)/FAD synthetase